MIPVNFYHQDNFHFVLRKKNKETVIVYFNLLNTVSI